MRVRILSAVPVIVLGLFFAAQATEARADTIFSNFGPNNTYSGVSWWDVGTPPSGSGVQVVAFPFMPSSTAVVTGADLALAGAPSENSPLNVFIESSVGGQPGSILATLTQTGSYSPYPTTSVVNFACTGLCATLNAGTTYWIVGQQTNAADDAYWMYGSDSGTWYYNYADSATGPWTTATAGNTFSAFDVTGTSSVSPVPEPGSLALLGSGLLGIVAVARRRMVKA